MASTFLDTLISDQPEPLNVPFYKRREFLLSIGVFLLALALYLPGLGDYYLWDPWEPQYGQVAWEMNEQGESLVMLYRGGNRWWSKPIMLMWMIKPSFLIFGQTEFAARFPVVLLTAAGLGWLLFLFSRLFNTRIGLVATLVLATSPQFYFIGRQAIYDMPYVIFQTIAVLYMLVGIFKYPDRPRWMYGFWIFSALAMLSKGLLAIVIPASIVGTYILITWEWSVLKTLRFAKGLIVFFAVAAPWFVYMTATFGVTYLDNFFIYHHFKRMAGEIGKPNNTFDLYVQQIFYATFPWASFLLMALVRFVISPKTLADRLARRNLMLFLCFAMPYIFFSFGSTKFNHYIFPVIPYLALMIGVYLVSLFDDAERRFPQFDIIMALAAFGILAKDITTNYKAIIHLFIYYYDRAMPANVNPRPYYYAIFIPMGLLLALPFLKKSWTKASILAFGLVTVVFMTFNNMWLVPRLTDLNSQAPLWEAYKKLAKPGEPLCEYNGWNERSVSYYSHNESVWLNSQKAETGKEKKFFSRPVKFFCQVHHNLYSKLRDKLKSYKRDLTIVYSAHPFTYLVASDPPKDGVMVPSGPPEDALLKSPPAPKNALKAEFAGKIRLLGWDSDRTTYAPGDPITLTFYFEALDKIPQDYTVFVHGDPEEETTGRLIGDHTPVDGRHPTDRWEPGQIIKDVWRGTIPARMSQGPLSLYIGFFFQEGRMKVTNGPSDDEDRVSLGTLTIAED